MASTGTNWTSLLPPGTSRQRRTHSGLCCNVWRKAALKERTETSTQCAEQRYICGIIKTTPEPWGFPYDSDYSPVLWDSFPWLAETCSLPSQMRAVFGCSPAALSPRERSSPSSSPESRGPTAGSCPRPLFQREQLQLTHFQGSCSWWLDTWVWLKTCFVTGFNHLELLLEFSAVPV